jgi:hypothetical protein
MGRKREWKRGAGGEARESDQSGTRFPDWHRKMERLAREES